MKAGWHLWSVALAGRGVTLWITTVTRDLAAAQKKAESFMRRSAKFRGAEIRSIEHHGTIDA
ncbi:hypothetical protein D4R30_00900 [archaeon]|nr:MAG: hypothetical protein D4R30_00900 [archaeon]